MADPNVIRKAPPISAGRRLWAFLAYLLGPIGWAIAFLFGRNDPFITFHIRQSIGVFGGFVIGALAWLAAGYAITIIPYFGPLIAAALFALVMALAAACAILWVVGMANALRGRRHILPLVGARAERWLGSEKRKPRAAGESYLAAAYANLMEQTKG
jgi:uncharacterized membrane protein